MDQAELNLMQHASKYYDPVKAHEYYIRNRNLKRQRLGLPIEEPDERQGGDSTSVRGSSRSPQVDSSSNKGVSTNNPLAASQARANALADKIKQKLDSRLATLDKQLKIPTNASPKVVAFLEKQNAQRSTNAKRASLAKLRGLGENLKTLISSARSQYAAAQGELAEKTERYQTTLADKPKDSRK